MPTVQQRHQAIRQALADHNVDLNQVITSVDPKIKQDIRWALDKSAEPPEVKGFRRFIFPVPLPRAAAIFQVIAPFSKMDTHSHPDEHIWHVVVLGCIWVQGEGMTKPVKLIAGEWIWVPKGKEYQFWTAEEDCCKLYFHIEGDYSPLA
jgi:quercetin dioxygenase-like cupin family protein